MTQSLTMSKAGAENLTTCQNAAMRINRIPLAVEAETTKKIGTIAATDIATATAAAIKRILIKENMMIDPNMIAEIVMPALDAETATITEMTTTTRRAREKIAITGTSAAKTRTQKMIMLSVMVRPMAMV